MNTGVTVPVSDVWSTSVEDADFCRRILPHVSRTFALSISFLPKRLGHTVTVAYLLCRIADTIEDDPQRNPAEKRRLLMHFADALDHDAPAAGQLASAFRDWDDAEGGLTARADRVLAEFARLSAEERNHITPWIRAMCAGMADTGDLLDAHGATGFRALHTLDELRQYCYYVAGTVGHLLTDLFRIDLDLDDNRTAELHRLGHGFGLGLQMTNIIKDIQDDRTRGVSFVPEALTATHGVTVATFATPATAAASRAVIRDLLVEARRYLDDGLHYCTLLPVRAYGVRRFCLSALFLARRTLRRIERTEGFPHEVHRLKITRPEVRRIVIASALIAPINPLVRGYYHSL